MRIEKSLIRRKVLILLFGLSWQMCAPLFGVVNSGGQLSLSVGSHEVQRPVGSDIHEKPYAQTTTFSLRGSEEQKTNSIHRLTQSHIDTENAQNKNKLKDISQSNTKKAIQEEDEKKFVFNFEDVDLASVAANIEQIFDIRFITDGSVKPTPQGGKVLSGHKISFKTQRPLTKKQALNLFETFLGMVGLYLVKQADPKLYRIKVVDKAKRSALQSFINVAPETLPDSDTLIRYGYFVKDCPLDTIQKVLETLKSTVGDVLILRDHNAFIITDIAYNIKVLMKIIKELDKVTMPQTMSVLRLHKVEASEVKKLYEELTSDKQEGTVATRLFGPKKPSRALYFPKNAKIIAEPRTNSLILLGTDEAIKKIETFITKYVDIDSKAPYSPFFVYDLKYADAQNVANIMTNLVKFGQDGNRKLAGAVRGGDKYFKKMTFTAEPENNRLIIRGNYDDFQKIKKILDDIDEPPVQVAIELLILGVRIEDRKDLGIQLRNKFKTPDGQQVNFQTSGITMGGPPRKVVENTNKNASGALRLLGDLINLVKAATPGTTAISLGSDKLGVWGMFGVLSTVADTQIVANPFLTATNNSKARVKLGETRRVESSIVQTGGDSTQAFQDLAANIEVTVRPTVNSDGMIVMELEIKFDTFIPDTADVKNARITRNVKSTIVAASDEILALGGLLRDREENSLSKTPILGNVPILGWFFKNKVRRKEKEDLLVLVTAHVVEPGQDVKQFTKRRIKEYKDDLEIIKEDTSFKRDPVDRAFFKHVESENKLEDYIFSRGKKGVKIVESDVKKAMTPRERRKKRRAERRKIAKLKKQKQQEAAKAVIDVDKQEKVKEKQQNENKKTSSSIKADIAKEAREKQQTEEPPKVSVKQDKNKAASSKTRASARRERRKKRRRNHKKVENPTLVV